MKDTKEEMLQLWTVLFSVCIKSNYIPEQWSKTTLKILYVGKGNADDMNSYRRVALENTTFKLFMELLTNKLNSRTDGHIPECQFGFRKERSTI